jgi:DNA (cytosine-5)-methyltransferase 1
MIHASFFSGEGGFDLAAEWMGWRNAFHCEINPFCQTILKHYWPNAVSYTDIRKTDFTQWRGGIDIVSGGFPCQPYSVAGQQLGTEDPRHLWPEYYRAIKEIAPPWVVGENVRGLVSWNGGLVFDQVQTDLENAGYEVFPIILPAAGVDAPHKRERIFFIAYSYANQLQSGLSEYKQFRKTIATYGGNYAIADAASDRRSGDGSKTSFETGQSESGEVRELERGSQGLRVHEFTSDADGTRRGQQYVANIPTKQGFSTGLCNAKHASDSNKQHGNDTRFSTSGVPQRQTPDLFGNPREWKSFPTQSPVCGGNDGFSAGLDAISVFNKSCKPAHARTFAKWRNESIKAHGNAVVPPLIYQIFKTVQAYEILY